LFSECLLHLLVVLNRRHGLGHMPHILVIDDDPLVRASLCVLLESRGYTVVTADCGRSGIQAVAKGAFDVVLCDVFMPEMDGFETIHAIHERDSAVPVIVISGFTFRNTSAPAPDFLAMATELGAACSLRKPFRPGDVLGAIETCIARRLAASAGMTRLRPQMAS
jgi:CheY-like chemotaxis protein